MRKFTMTRSQVRDLMLYIGLGVEDYILDNWTVYDLAQVECWCFQKCVPSASGRRCKVPKVISQLLEVNPDALQPPLPPRQLPEPILGPQDEYVVWSLSAARGRHSEQS